MDSRGRRKQKILQSSPQREARIWKRKCTPAVSVKGYALYKIDDRKKKIATEFCVGRLTLSVLPSRDMQLIFSLYVFLLLFLSMYTLLSVCLLVGPFVYFPLDLAHAWLDNFDTLRDKESWAGLKLTKMEMTYAKTFTLWNYLMGLEEPNEKRKKTPLLDQNSHVWWRLQYLPRNKQSPGWFCQDHKPYFCTFSTKTKLSHQNFPSQQGEVTKYWSSKLVLRCKKSKLLCLN